MVDPKGRPKLEEQLGLAFVFAFEMMIERMYRFEQFHSLWDQRRMVDLVE